jgi:hypothetical protein
MSNEFKVIIRNLGDKTTTKNDGNDNSEYGFVIKNT